LGYYSGALPPGNIQAIYGEGSTVYCGGNGFYKSVNGGTWNSVSGVSGSIYDIVKSGNDFYAPVFLQQAPYFIQMIMELHV
jgi:hypothetical protein